MLPLQLRVDLGTMAMKGYSTYSIALRLKPHISLFNVISRTLVRGVLLFCQDAVGVFYSLSWLGWFVKVTNHTGLWDVCSPDSLRATHQVCFYDLKHGIRIYGFRSTRPCMIIKVLATKAKFLEPSAYSTIINSTMILWLSVNL